MPAREVGAAIKNWAIKNNAYGTIEGARAFDEEVAINALRPAGLRAATAILQKKPISFVAIDEVENEVIILTSKGLNRREMRILSAAGAGDTTIRFEKGGVGLAGRVPAAPVGTMPFGLHNGRYSCGSSVYLGDQPGAGTMGALVRDNDGQLFGLSNNHVTGGSNYATRALPIIAPGMVDVAAGGQDPFTIGGLTYALSIDRLLEYFEVELVSGHNI